MDYATSLSHLKELFLHHDFEGHRVGKRKHAVTTNVDTCQNGSLISISFPGYKASPVNFDYRVDLTKAGVTTPLSHANVIVDIVNKCTVGGMDLQLMKRALKRQAINCDIDYAAFAKHLPYTPHLPPPILLAQVRAAHGGKPYNEHGNSWDLTIEELFKSIKWIVIQEDINYPIARGFLGRKMSYFRYLETIHTLETSSHSLSEVIQRALSHTRPLLWNDMDYSFENNIS